MSVFVLTLKPSQVISSAQNQVNFDPNAEVRSISIPALNVGHFSISPDTKTKLISIQTLKQVIFDPRTKPSHFWSLHWNQVNSDPPHWNYVYFDHPHDNQVNFDANNKTMPFSGHVTSRLIPQYMFFWYNSNTRNIITTTNSFYSGRFHTTIKPENVAQVYTIFFLGYMVYTRLRVI